MAKTRGRRRGLKVEELAVRLLKNLKVHLEEQGDFICEILHSQGKRLHLSIWPGGTDDGLGRQARKELLLTVRKQLRRLRIAVRNFVAGSRCVYYDLRVKPA